jgi:hypothetical protein
MMDDPFSLFCDQSLSTIRAKAVDAEAAFNFGDVHELATSNRVWDE